MLAEEFGIPVGIHVGEGPPGVSGLIPAYRAGLTSPYLVEEVLARHPKLRLYVMHYGSPMIDEVIAMLADVARRAAVTQCRLRFPSTPTE